MPPSLCWFTSLLWLFVKCSCLTTSFSLDVLAVCSNLQCLQIIAYIFLSFCLSYDTQNISQVHCSSDSHGGNASKPVSILIGKVNFIHMLTQVKQTNYWVRGVNVWHTSLEQRERNVVEKLPITPHGSKTYWQTEAIINKFLI